MGASPEPGDWLWPGTRLRIANVLVEAEGALTGSEIARVLNADPSNINKELVALETAGLVGLRPPDPAEPPPPHRPSRYWILDADQRGIAESVLSTNPEPRRPPRRAKEPDNRQPRRARLAAPVAARTDITAVAQYARTASSTGITSGMELVIAKVDRDRIVDLMSVLAESQARPRAAWTALCGDELIFAFSESPPADHALDLMAVLDPARRGEIRRATVARVWPREGFIEHARSSAGAAARTRRTGPPQNE